ncbi:hypothetical protein [Streptomyces sp. NPDC001568]|uniref:hypothetical protein n=1 Tax=Streptomyces sp. NPDC001568 TaxID=3364588 RepID=UPI0036A7DA44
MNSVPVVVHRCLPSDGQQVIMRSGGREEILGRAHSDTELIMFLEAAGVIEAENALDDPNLVD